MFFANKKFPETLGNSFEKFNSEFKFTTYCQLLALFGENNFKYVTYY